MRALALATILVVCPNLTRAVTPDVFQEYARPAELTPLPTGTASLYRTPWRASVKTASAFEALQGIGVYWKHIPHEWTLDDQTHLLKEIAKAGVSRVRLAPHFAIYVDKDWVAPKPLELEILREELGACRAAGIRPCVVFVHIPPVGKAGTREFQEWWTQSPLMPAGDVGSAEFKAYQDVVYRALKFVLDEARSAGFIEEDSYDLELGQNLWWGAPSITKPFPSTDLDALRPGGRIYEFTNGLGERARADGYAEPTLWWGQTHHHFEDIKKEELPPNVTGRAVSIYSAWTGDTATNWLQADLFNRGPNDVWPARASLTFAEGPAPAIILARPESWMADRTRRDNLLQYMESDGRPVAITSLGTVPTDIPGHERSEFNGWQLKARGLTRSLAFWLNQDARFVLLHSAYEPGAAAGGEHTHSLIPAMTDAKTFSFEQSIPLQTLKRFVDGLAGSKKLEKLSPLSMRFRLIDDADLIPATGAGQPLRASDAVTLLPFQIDENTYALAAYVMTPNIAVSGQPMTIEVQVDKSIEGAATFTVPYTGGAGDVKSVSNEDGVTTLRFEIRDDVTWVRFSVK